MAWESYETTERIVLAYKERQPLAAQQLLEAFENFTNKYLEVIVEGKIHLSNPSIRRFISLFMKDEEYRKNIHKFKKAPSIIYKATIGINHIKAIFRLYEADDIRSILAIDLLELADKYEPMDDKPRFHAYLLKSYHYKIYHTLMSAVKDPLYRCMIDGGFLPENNIDTATYDNYNLNMIDRKYGFLITESDCSVDDNWVAGFTSNLFSEFSPVDRKILKMKYIDGLTDSEIGDKLSVCRATINRRRIRVEKDLKDKLLRLNMIKE